MNAPTSHPAAVGRVPSRGEPPPPPGVPLPAPDEPPPRRLRRLHRVWPDRDGNISYLLTMCVDGRQPVLDNEATLDRLVAFLRDSPTRYHWFGRRFVVMPDHIHLIAHMGHESIRLGQWIKALKAVVGGLKAREEIPVRTPGLVGRVPSHGDPMPADGATASHKENAASGDAAYKATHAAAVGRVPSRGVPMSAHDVPAPCNVGRVPPRDATPHEFTRIKRAWRWQDGYHDHKFRTPESEARKWEYVCLNPVRHGLVQHPEEWPFGGEIFYDDAGGPRLVRGTPLLLETGMLIAEDDGGATPREGEPKTPGGGEAKTPGEGTRPTT